MTQTGKWIGQAWQLVMQHFGAFLLFTLVYLIALMGINYLTCGLGLFVLFGPLQAGVYALILHLIKTGQFDVGQIGRGFNRFGDASLAYLILTAFVLGILLVFAPPGIPLFIYLAPFIEQERAPASASLILGATLGGAWLLLLYIALFLLQILYLFPWMLIVDRKLSFWPAMEESRKMVQKSLLGFVGFLLTLAAINLLGLLPCGLGIFITFPLQLCAMVFAYRDLWPEQIPEIVAPAGSE